MKKFRKNNKGFTLVELIIVVAIIAVLSAVAAPQYIKYVERSRQGVDASTLEEVRHAVEVEVGVMETVAAGTVVIDNAGALTGTGSFVHTGTDTTNYDQVTAIVGTSVDLKSKAATKSGASFTISISADGVVTWGSCTPTVAALQAGTAPTT